MAAKFKDLGHRTARGLPWTGANISSYLRKLKIFTATSSALSIGVSSKPQPIADVNRQLAPDGVERVKKAMIAEGFKPGTTGKLMTRLGFNRHDVSIGHPLLGLSALKQVHLEALEAWISKIEATA